MHVFRSVCLSLLPLALLSHACGTESRKSKAPDTPTIAPVAPTTCAHGQVLDAESNSCRKVTERDCLEQNTTFNGLACASYFPTLPNDTASAPKIDFNAYCEKNAAGAFVNCKDGEYLLPVAAIAHVDATPEAFKTLAVDQEIKLQHSIQSTGAVKLTWELGAEPVDLLKPTDATAPWLIRKLKVGDSIPMKVTFAPDAVIHGQSEIRIAEQFVTYHDKNQILEAISSQTISNKWLAEETERQRKARKYATTLNSEWLSFLKNDVKGAVVWSLNEKCPKEQQRKFLATSTCLVDQKIESKVEWENLPFIYTCTSTRGMTIEYADQRYGLLNYGKFLDGPFSILIPKEMLFIGPDCFIKIVE